MNIAISQLMQREVWTAGFDDTVQSVEAQMAARGVTWIPVIDGGGTILGVISASDLLRLRADGKDAAHVRAWQVCTYKPIVVASDASASEVAWLMVKQGIHHVVVREPSGACGVVSSMDFVRAFSELLAGAMPGVQPDAALAPTPRQNRGYERILVPVDGSVAADHAVAEAVKLSGVTAGAVKFLHVVDRSPIALRAAITTAGPIPSDHLRRRGEQVLERAGMAAAEAGLTATTLLQDSDSGRVCEAVVDEAKAWSADLIVVGTHGRRGAGRLLLGSDAEEIVRLSPVPVLLVRGKNDD
jgi:nucleotide-binding universal stress UspA family protein